MVEYIYTHADWMIYFLFLHPTTPSADLVLDFQSLGWAGAGQAAGQENGEQQGEGLHPEDWRVGSLCDN